MQRLKDRSHQAKLACRFEDLYRNRVLTDVILFTSDGMELKAHWLILAAYSEIFKQLAISRKTMKNDCVGTVVRLEFTSDIVAILLNYCYKGELIITIATKPQVQKAAQLLLMNDILKLLESNELDEQATDYLRKDKTEVTFALSETTPTGEITLGRHQEFSMPEGNIVPRDDIEGRRGIKTTGIWPDSLKSTTSLLKQFSEIVTLQSEAGKLKPQSVAPTSSSVPAKDNSKYISLDLSNLEKSKLRKEIMRSENPLLKKQPTIPVRRVTYNKVICPRERKSKDTWKPSLSIKIAKKVAEKVFNTRILMHCCVTLDSLDTNDKLFLCRKCNKKFSRFSLWRLHYTSTHLSELVKGTTLEELRTNTRHRKMKMFGKRKRERYFDWEVLNPLGEDNEDSVSTEGFPAREYDIDNNIQVTFQPAGVVSNVSGGQIQPAAQTLPGITMTTPPPASAVTAAIPLGQPTALPDHTISSYMAAPQYSTIPLPQTQYSSTPLITVAGQSAFPEQMQQTTLQQTTVQQTTVQQTTVQQSSLGQTTMLGENNLQIEVPVQTQVLTQAPALAGTSTLPQVQALPDPNLAPAPIPGPSDTPSASIASASSVTLSPSIAPNQTLSTQSTAKPTDQTSSQWLPSHESWMSFLQSDSFTASVLGPPPPQPQNTQYITMVKCSVKGCSFAGYSTRAVNKHMHDTHLNMECSYCMFACSNKEELERHIAERHERKKARQYSCSSCGKKFSKAIHHRTHEQSHHGINHNMKEYKCEVEGCEFRTLAKHNYFKHKMTHQEKMYSCQYCGIKIRTMDYLQRHINKQHLNIRPFQCEHCGSAFGDMHALKSHISAVHVKKKEFKCEHCSYAANIRYKVATHMYQVHGIRASFDKRKEIKCPHCNYTALVKSWMTKHMDRHATTKNYTCELCGKTFGSPRNLNSHTRWAHKTAKHQCPHCEYITKTPTRLKNHIKTQHMFRGYKPYTCPYCPFKCATGGNCRKHVMQKHPGQTVTYNRNEELIAYMKAAGRTTEEDESFTQVVS
ncbi:uncharacterized protein LOC124139453 [Haliotis rufescens]|uniref:uncharacterized protein LOC124139453 n=1 Tax=Haliotis rufescens TaxID=6454 RepID=UPI00201F520F|nr:uncharacterized protein LOC124139453 [Haliotis rufescens]